MSAAIYTNIHDVSSIVTHRKQINGEWQRRLEVTCGDGTVLTFVLFAPTDESTRIIEQPDEYVRVEDYMPVVARSDTPFDLAGELRSRLSSESSAGTSGEAR